MTTTGDFCIMPIITCHGRVGNAGDEKRKRNVNEKECGEIHTTFLATRSDGNSRYSLESIVVIQELKVSNNGKFRSESAQKRRSKLPLWVNDTSKFCFLIAGYIVRNWRLRHNVPCKNWKSIDQHREELLPKNMVLLFLKSTYSMHILNVMKLRPSLFIAEGNFLYALFLFVLLD